MFSAFSAGTPRKNFLLLSEKECGFYYFVTRLRWIGVILVNGILIFACCIVNGVLIYHYDADATNYMDNVAEILNP